MTRQCHSSAFGLCRCKTSPYSVVSDEWHWRGNKSADASSTPAVYRLAFSAECWHDWSVLSKA